MDPFKHIPSLIELNISICTPILIKYYFQGATSPNIKDNCDQK